MKTVDPDSTKGKEVFGIMEGSRELVQNKNQKNVTKKLYYFLIPNDNFPIGRRGNIIVIINIRRFGVLKNLKIWKPAVRVMYNSVLREENIKGIGLIVKEHFALGNHNFIKGREPLDKIN